MATITKFILFLPLFFLPTTFAYFFFLPPFRPIGEKFGFGGLQYNYAHKKKDFFPIPHFQDTGERYLPGGQDTMVGAVLPPTDTMLPFPMTPLPKGSLPLKPLPFSKSQKLVTSSTGSWQLFSNDSGVSAMHVNLLPNNKIIMIDSSAFHISALKLPVGEKCVPWKDKEKNDTEKIDCWAHAVEFDINTGKVRPLKLTWDPWCSSGGLAPDGTLVSTGGWFDGDRSVRYFKPCDDCEFREYQNSLASSRWYASQATLPDGSFILFGGRRSFSYEFVPREGQNNPLNSQAMFQFLFNATDVDENSLYPFVHLSTDGNIFVFANRWSVLLDYKAGKIIRNFPPLAGTARNYPGSAMSALLPINLQPVNPSTISAEVIVCGGSPLDAYQSAEKGIFLPALHDCQRIKITDSDSEWKQEIMPSARVMGDMLILPTGDLLILNGAKTGTSAWKFAEQPNFSPVLYSPYEAEEKRFKELAPTQIARMYHSTSAVLPDGKILVSGSNTNPGYDYKAKYPTELRVEKFSPPYLAPELQINRPEIIIDRSFAVKWNYGKVFTIQFKLNPADKVVLNEDIMVTMYPPPFTTHGYSMNQRLIVLGKNQVGPVRGSIYRADVVAPPSGVIAPLGYYLLFVVYRGVPSVGAWIQIL